MLGRISVSDPLAVTDLLHSISAAKRRIDEHFKSAVCHDAMAEKRAKTVTAFAQAHGDTVNTKSAFSWVGHHMSKYRCATLMSFNGARALSTAFDASRLGSPKEETLCIAVLDVDRQLGCWVPPQVASFYDVAGPIFQTTRHSLQRSS